MIDHGEMDGDELYQLLGEFLVRATEQLAFCPDGAVAKSEFGIGDKTYEIAIKVKSS